MINRRQFTSLLGAAAAPARRRPNIVLILTDDLGWAELGCYGNTFNRTPNLDRLAAEGVRFTQAYSAAPVCSPTRASIITGQHPARVGITDYLRADDPNHLRPSPASLPAMLKGAGYRTGLIGKWHLMGDYRTRRGDPKLHGFDEVICSESSYIGPGYYWHPYQHLAGVPARVKGEYLTDRLNQEAVDFVGRNSAQPFFLYLSHYAPHTRLDGKPELVEQYKVRPGAGEKRNNPVLAAMLESIDQGLGLLWDELRRGGLDRDTLVIFSSDNGGETTVTTNTGLRGGKSQLYEGGIRVPLVARWPGQIPGGRLCAAPVVSTDLYPTLLQAAGARRPAGKSFDGSSILPVMQKPGTAVPEREICWYYPLERDHFLGGRSAMCIRRGRWKLIEFLGSGERQLFDLQDDPGETRDLLTSRKRVADELAGRLAVWRADTVKAPA